MRARSPANAASPSATCRRRTRRSPTRPSSSWPRPSRRNTSKLRRILKAWEADHPVEALHPEEIHDDVHDRFNELGGYRLEAKAKQILAGLELPRKGLRPARRAR